MISLVDERARKHPASLQTRVSARTTEEIALQPPSMASSSREGLEESKVFSSVLVVSCTADVPEAIARAVTSFTECGNEAELSFLLSTVDFKLVVGVLDPSSLTSVRTLEAVRDIVQRRGIPLVSLSIFNPPWIKNLMQRLDVAEHFEQMPSAEQISLILSRPAKQNANISFGASK